MKRFLLSIVIVGSFVAIPALPSQASWVSTHCYVDNMNDSYVKRSDARAYAVVAIDEGYEYGGGCWNNNNVDDTPGQPDSGGEGPDCSGLVFKSWELKATSGADGFQWWSKWQNIHGPYSSNTFHDVGTTSSLPFFQIPKNAAYSMDAFARDGHIGLVYGPGPNPDGTWMMLEAKGDQYGVHTYSESWLYDNDYEGVRRKDWTPECWPTCM
jgi:hypothetical protein